MWRLFCLANNEHEHERCGCCCFFSTLIALIIYIFYYLLLLCHCILFHHVRQNQQNENTLQRPAITREMKRKLFLCFCACRLFPFHLFFSPFFLLLNYVNLLEWKRVGFSQFAHFLFVLKGWEAMAYVKLAIETHLFKWRHIVIKKQTSKQ